MKHPGPSTPVLKVTAPIQETHFSNIERTPHRWSLWLLICCICLISSFSLTHQTHRVTCTLVKQLSIVTPQLDLAGKESSYIVVGLDQKEKKKRGNILVNHNPQDLQRRYKNPRKRYIRRRARSQFRPSRRVPSRCKKLHQQQKHHRKPTSSCRSAAKPASLRKTSPTTNQERSRERTLRCRNSQEGKRRSPPKSQPYAAPARRSAPTSRSTCEDQHGKHKGPHQRQDKPRGENQQLATRPTTSKWQGSSEDSAGRQQRGGKVEIAASIRDPEDRERRAWEIGTKKE